MPMISPTVCECGIPWEEMCQCPEHILEYFSDYHADKTNSPVFYYEDILKWLTTNYGETTAKDLINDVLNLEGVVELGDSMYLTPYEMS